MFFAELHGLIVLRMTSRPRTTREELTRSARAISLGSHEACILRERQSGSREHLPQRHRPTHKPEQNAEWQRPADASRGSRRRIGQSARRAVAPNRSGPGSNQSPSHCWGRAAVVIKGAVWRRRKACSADTPISPLARLVQSPRRQFEN